MYILYKEIKKDLCPFYTQRFMCLLYQVVDTTNRERVIFESGFPFGPAYDHI